MLIYCKLSTVSENTNMFTTNIIYYLHSSINTVSQNQRGKSLQEKTGTEHLAAEHQVGEEEHEDNHWL